MTIQSHIVAFFAASNRIVLENLARRNFMKKAQVFEANNFYLFDLITYEEETE
jgi:hypothetical protein